MATVTATEIIARAQAAADMTDNFITETQWLYWLNVENRALAVMLARLNFPWRQEDQIVSCNGSLEYTLSEPLAVLGAFYLEDDGRLRRLELMHPSQRRVAAVGISGKPAQWSIRRQVSGSNIYVTFYPAPSSGSVYVQCIMPPATVTVGGSVYYPLNWEERIVLGMARRALAKEETVNPVLEDMIKDIEVHIESSAFDQLMLDAPVIRNTRKDNLRDYEGWIFL
jgi:hypothetical protein